MEKPYKYVIQEMITPSPPPQPPKKIKKLTPIYRIIIQKNNNQILCDNKN